MPKKTVTIQLQGNVPVCSPDPLEVERGDVIEWKCDDGNFAILLKDQSPCNGHSAGGRRNGKAPLTVSGSAQQGDYAYAVMVVDAQGEARAADPIIHVL